MNSIVDMLKMDAKMLGLKENKSLIILILITQTFQKKSIQKNLTYTYSVNSKCKLMGNLQCKFIVNLTVNLWQAYRASLW